MVDEMSESTEEEDVVAEDKIEDPGENYNFMKDLWFSMIDEEVRTLQKVLNKLGFKLASEGAGSPGNETNYFGSRTKNALIKFQEAHADKILNPIGLVNGTGHFGEMTRKFINSL